MPRKRYTSLKHISGSYQQGVGQDRPEITQVLIKQQKRRNQCVRPLLRQLSEVVVALISNSIESGISHLSSTSLVRGPTEAKQKIESTWQGS